jgi:hypothetical protein
VCVVCVCGVCMCVCVWCGVYGVCVCGVYGVCVWCVRVVCVCVCVCGVFVCGVWYVCVVCVCVCGVCIRTSVSDTCVGSPYFTRHMYVVICNADAGDRTLTDAC